MAEAGEKPAGNLQDAAQQAARDKVTSPPKRERRTYLFEIGLFAVIGAFTTLTILVKITPSFPVDLAITRLLQSIDSPIFAALMELVSWPGFSPQSYLLAAGIVGILYLFGFQWESVAALFAAVFTALLNGVIKQIIQRPRPTIDLVEVFQNLDSYSFPSGHVMFYVGFFGFLWFLAYVLLKRTWLRTSLLLVLGSLIALVGVSRVYLGQHWPSDVLGAYLLGSLCLVTAIELYRWGKKRFFVHQPAAAEDAKASKRPSRDER